MKTMLIVTAAALTLAGCQTASNVNTDTPAAIPAKPAAPVLTSYEAYALLPQAEQQRLIALELRMIGTAIKAYAKAHNGKWPASLSALIAEDFLPAGALISSADPSRGREGGVPDSYDTWQQSSETDEAGSSYLYEFSGATANWDWKSYLAGKPSVADADTDRSGEVSWAEAKAWQLARGDTAQATAGPYAKNRFPVVRCYWYVYPTAKDDISLRSVISLAADLETIILSQPWWEKDSAPAVLLP